ncbi:MAG: hypothetical protein V1748_01710 [Actinomycetota bacterium]
MTEHPTGTPSGGARLPRPPAADPAKDGARYILVIFSLILSVAGILMLFSTAKSAGRGGPQPSAVVGVAWLILGIALGAAGVAAITVMLTHRLAVSRFSGRGRRVADSYSTKRCHRFREAFDAVSIGLGIQAPPLEVMDLPSPNAYVLPGGRGLAVTPTLLEQDMSDQQVEAVMAAILARLILMPKPAVPLQRRGSVEEGPVLSDEIRHRYALGANEYMNRPGVLADTLAARITGNPRALIEAIVQVSWLVKKKRVTPFGVRPAMMFIRPSMAGVQERVESLEGLEKGMRRPYHEVRDGRPTAMPEAWD